MQVGLAERPRADISGLSSAKAMTAQTAVAEGRKRAAGILVFSQIIRAAAGAGAGGGEGEGEGTLL